MSTEKNKQLFTCFKSFWLKNKSMIDKTFTFQSFVKTHKEHSWTLIKKEAKAGYKVNNKNVTKQTMFLDGLVKHQ